MTVDAEGSEPQDGRRLRWQEHNQARRQVIINAAIAVLERQTPGEDVQVQAVADKAGMSRTVIYRHFEDRADLDREVQRQISDMIGREILSALAYDGTLDQIVHAVIDRFVRWAEAHPALYWFAERDLAGWGPSPMSQGIAQVADGIEEFMSVVVAALDFELSPVDKAALDPWVFGMIGGAFATVRRWLERDPREPDTEICVNFLAESLWVQISGLAHTRGINLPDLPVAELLPMLGGTDSESDSIPGRAKDDA